jgi:DNA-binding PadR family transcriptional regulator
MVNIKKSAKNNVKNSSHFVNMELKGFLGFFILHELSKKPLSGDELACLIGQRKGSERILTAGTIYPALKRLRKQKLVFFRRKGRKKNYMLTDAGSAELKNLYALFNEYFADIIKKK